MRKLLFGLSLFVLLASCSVKQNNFTLNKQSVSYQQITAEKQTNQLSELKAKLSDGTWENPKIVLDPYGISPLVALVAFNQEKAEEVTVTVKGKLPLSKTYPAKKDQLIEVIGLYPGVVNEVELTTSSSKKTIYIETAPLADNVVLPTKLINNQKEKTNDWYFYSPSGTEYTAAYDLNGDVRWYLTERFFWQIKVLKNGNLIGSTDRLSKTPYYSTGFKEIDLSGKIIKEYTVPGGYHHDLMEKEDGNFIVASSNYALDTVEDVVVEIDRQSGEIVKEIDLKDIWSTTDGKNVRNYSAEDWFHNNSVWYDEQTDQLILSGRHQDIVVSLDYQTEKINWILGDPTNWSEEMQQYFLTPINDDFEYQYAQHAAMLTPDNNLFLFDNGQYKTKTKDNKVEANDSYSRGVMYQINQADLTVKQIFAYGKERGAEFYSSYISDVDYLGPEHYIIHSGGISANKGDYNNEPTPLVPHDFVNSITVELVNNEVVWEMQLPANMYRVEKIDPLTIAENPLGEITLVGNLSVTETIDEEIDFSTAIDATNENFSFVLENDRLIANITCLKTDKVDLVLQSAKETLVYQVSTINEKGFCVFTFNQDDDSDILDVTSYITVSKADAYNIYLKINDQLINTGQYVTFN